MPTNPRRRSHQRSTRSVACSEPTRVPSVSKRTAVSAPKQSPRREDGIHRLRAPRECCQSEKLSREECSVLKTGNRTDGLAPAADSLSLPTIGQPVPVCICMWHRGCVCGGAWLVGWVAQPTHSKLKTLHTIFKLALPVRFMTPAPARAVFQNTVF